MTNTLSITGTLIEVGDLEGENGARGFVLDQDGSAITIKGLTEDQARAMASGWNQRVTATFIIGELQAAPAPALAGDAQPVALGPWRYDCDTGAKSHICRYFIESDGCDETDRDARLYINGNFGGDEDVAIFGKEIARKLNAAPPQPVAQPEVDEDKMIELAEALKDVELAMALGIDIDGPYNWSVMIARVRELAAVPAVVQEAKIERFSIYEDHGRAGMMGDDDGDYVLYSDYARLAAPSIAVAQDAQGNCSALLRKQGKAYPRTCMACKFGPCRFDVNAAPPLPAVAPQEPEAEPTGAGMVPLVTLNGAQIQELMDAVSGESDTEITLASCAAPFKSTDGEEMEAGVYFYWTDYPDEGIVPLVTASWKPATTERTQLVAPALPEVPAVAPADEWQECQRISDVPDVHETLSDFASDPNGDAGVCVVRAILAAAKKGAQ